MINESLNKTNFINLLFFFIPISFIAGNLIINLNILFFIITALIFYRDKIFKIKLLILDKLIIVFFVYALIVGFSYNLFEYFQNSSEDFKVITKSIGYLRFLIFYFIIRFLIIKDLINFKLFFFSCGFCALFVCVDLIIQLSFGQDIFGYKPTYARVLSGPFGDEWIAGSYVQRFSPFLFFLVPLFFNLKNKNLLKVISVFLIILVLFSALIAGNRMPFFLLLLIMTLIIIFESSARKYLLYFVILFSIILFITFKFKPSTYVHFGNFYMKGMEIITELKKKDSNVFGPVYRTHYKEFYSGYQTWKTSKFFGGGIKSFSPRCTKVVINCANHPHNYYLEILSDLGLVGFLILSIVFGLVLYDTFYKKYLVKSALKNNNIIIPFMFLFVAEIFPFKTSGSFFTTGNATYFFIIMSITIALSKKEKLN